ncbi:MAG: tRNA (N6-threonylcarbamoyladenosine(37)-N6)-methyltransferase TrmO [Deltaproteobacteria bacterium]|jgi:tRNA-Thr(GGU) m(6)t(6)A37 methyltransferase TsaA|nr:tRNA (N6-threonylcarbamoyladenosine(37)-N6)-methyltransferase TrmO [Deltaproteobacteria bacterium]
MKEHFSLYPIGVVIKQDERIWIDIFDDYSDGLLGLEGFSHINVLFWFHENDTPDKRAVLQVHPRRDEQNPLTGVFATHSPVRPNLIGLTRCKILSIEGNRIVIEDIDALDGTPVIDIKCYIPHSVADSEVRVPDWV